MRVKQEENSLIAPWCIDARTALVGLAIVFLLGASRTGLAFDTGHHFDLTASVLREQGFNGAAVDVTQLANWLTDYYSNAGAKELQRECQKLHFDNLYSTKEVTWYWHQFASNALSATQVAAKEDDAIKMLTVLGVTLHAMQDFYSHSNWIDNYPRKAGGPYRAETWWSMGGKAPGRQFTGKYEPYPRTPPTGIPDHGGYNSGLNKDSHIRPRWDEAYVFAYCACHEFVAQMKTWAERTRPGFWSSVQKLTLGRSDREALDKDLVSAYQISLWVAGKQDVDGHWKGNHSGLVRAFVAAGAKFLGRSSSVFVRQFTDEKTHVLLSRQLYANVVPPNPPTIKPLSIRRNVIILRTVKIAEDPDVRFGERKIDPLGRADFYARISIGGQQYIERTLQDEVSYDDPWWTIHFEDPGVETVPISLQVIDEDDDPDDVCDINPKPRRTALTMDYLVKTQTLQGDVTGQHTTVATAAASQGRRPEQDRASIKFFVTHHSLK